MKQRNVKKQILKDESGLITLDFIFSLAVAFGISMVFFAISFTLSMVEACQYVTFASARAYYGANTDPQAQQKLGEAKYDELMGQGLFKSLTKGGWISLEKPTFGDFSQLGSGLYEDKTGGGVTNPMFVGARAKFHSNVLHLRLPLFGDTVTDDVSTGTAYLNAFLMREVTTQECLDFTNQRLDKIKQLSPQFQALHTSAFVITDNGC